MSLDANNSPIFSRFLNWAIQFTAGANATAVEGGDYDLPGHTAYTTASMPIVGGGSVEVNLTTPAAQVGFSWQAEISIDDRANSLYRHILLQTDGTIVETIGKNVTPIDDVEAEELLKLAQKLIRS